MKAIINYRYRRMAKSTGDKCFLPLFMNASDQLKCPFIAEIEEVLSENELKFNDDSVYSSVWVHLPLNTIFELSEESKNGYARILGANNKLEEINWQTYCVYVQLVHFEDIPKRYDVQLLEEDNAYQILRYNFSYNYYVPMQKLPLFNTESDAWTYVKSNLEDW